MTITSLQDLFVLELQDLYSVKQKTLQAATKKMEASTHKELKKAFKYHIKETEKQAKRLEKTAKLMNIDPNRKSCEIIKEGGEIIKMDFASSIKDIAIIASAQKVEHSEISGYGTAIEMGRLLKQKNVEMLKEVKHSDKSLTQIAKTRVNNEAQNIKES